MTEQEIRSIKNQWEVGVSISKIVKTMPYQRATAFRKIWELQEKGVLPPRERKRGRELVIDAYKSGMKNPYEIAETYGYAINSVRNWLSNAGLNRDRPKKNWKKTDCNQNHYSDRTKEILEHLRGGMGVNRVARVFGVSKQWVSAIKKRSENNGEL